MERKKSLNLGSKPQITLGADPEFFLVSEDGELKSAIDRIGGNKVAPRGLGRQGFFVQEDNVAVEFNIPPAKDVQEWVANLQYAMNEITIEVKTQGVKPIIKAAALFPALELEDPRAQAFGCDPDFNAWNGGQTNPKPSTGNPRLRSCGGHIHVGYPSNSGIDRFRLIQLMDFYLGVPSVLMDGDEDSQDRRLLYGKAGAFRPQDYGVEYRVLSNFWLKEPRYMAWAYENAHQAIDQAIAFGKPKVGKKDSYHEFMECFDLGDEIQECINTGDPILAQKLVAHYNLQVL